jgi:hypothetical protein
MTHRPGTGPPDRQMLHLLDRKIGTHPLVAATDYDPDAHEPRILQVLLDGNQYPTDKESPRLDIRWFKTDDFSIHYFESNGDRWECRWDRHPNPHNARTHFHEPPDCNSIQDITLPDHPLDVLFTVLEAVTDRIERIWETK